MTFDAREVKELTEAQKASDTPEVKFSVILFSVKSSGWFLNRSLENTSGQPRVKRPEVLVHYWSGPYKK